MAGRQLCASGTIGILAFVVAAGSAVAGAEPALRVHFWDAEDVHDTYGKIVFRTEKLKDLGRAPGFPSMRFSCTAPREEGGMWAYGWSCYTADHQGKPNAGLKVIRCYTNDGEQFHDTQTVYTDESRKWLGFTNIVRRLTDGKLFMFAWAHGPKGMGMLTYASGDGRNWQRIADPAYHGHDACCVIWDQRTNKFINYQTTYQDWKKKYPDNIGGEIRRVQSIRTSTDGIHWEPPGDFPYRSDPWRKRLWIPDENDPAELEFYHMCVFPYQGRYTALMCLYAPSPQIANTRKNTKHGPGLGSQWCFSRDGLNWSRPDRDTDANEDVSYIPLQGPLRAGGMLRFYAGIEGNFTCGLDEDRIFCTFCRANGEFSSRPFKMPDADLCLNASVNRYDSYVMVELLDESGKVVPGFEKDKCVLMAFDETAGPLRWNDQSARALAGKTIRARLYFRDARIYDLRTSKP